MLAVFAEFEREILRDRVKAGIAQARKQGKPHGPPPTVKACSAEIKRLFARGLSKREIAKRLKIGRTSVRRILAQKNPGPLRTLFPHIPSSGIFRVAAANWLYACLSLRRSRNIKSKAR